MTYAKTLCSLLLILITGCGAPDDRPEVVVYCALDRVHAEPILNRFEAETGVRVLARYDAEAAKTTGLVNRLIDRADDPDGDVFWNNEVVQTVRLAERGVLAPYQSPEAARFPAGVKDPGHLWTGFAARARLLITHDDPAAAAPPSELEAWGRPGATGPEAAVALPFFGTTLTHAAVLRERWGEERLEAWARGLLANGVTVAPGNGPVRDLVAAGECAFGLTDTDDARGAQLDGLPVRVSLPDGPPVLIPNTVGLVRGAPHPEEAKRLIDFLLSAGVERELAAGRGAQIPLAADLAGVQTPWDEMLPGRELGFDPVAVAAGLEPTVQLLRRAGFGG